MAQGEATFFEGFFLPGFELWPGTLLLRKARNDQMTLVNRAGTAQTVCLCKCTNSCCFQLPLPGEL